MSDDNVVLYGVAKALAPLVKRKRASEQEKEKRKRRGELGPMGPMGPMPCVNLVPNFKC